MGSFGVPGEQGPSVTHHADVVCSGPVEHAEDTQNEDKDDVQHDEPGDNTLVMRVKGPANASLMYSSTD